MPVQELAYLLVLSASEAASVASRAPGPARYSFALLRQTLQLMGVKPRQSDKTAHKVFLILQQRAALPSGEPLSLAARLHTAPGGHAGVTLSRLEFDQLVMDCLAASDTQQQQQQQQQDQVPGAAKSSATPLLSTASDPAITAATAAAAVGDFRIACALREQRASVAVLLCGTSGTGKSTLAALLAARLGISTVVSTDSIRHMMRRCDRVQFVLDISCSVA